MELKTEKVTAGIEPGHLKKMYEEKMTPQTKEQLKDYLLSHEIDIYNSINDFGELVNVFAEVVGREVGSPVYEPCMTPY